jgi:hypothetical protein
MSSVRHISAARPISESRLRSRALSGEETIPPRLRGHAMLRIRGPP